MANNLQTVERYIYEGLGILQNRLCLGSTSNNYFDDFQNFVGNLGETVKIQKPYRMFSQSGLSATTDQDIVERVSTLTVSEQNHVRFTTSNLEQLFNDYALNSRKLNMLRESSIAALSTRVESNLWGEVVDKTYRSYTFDSNINYTQIARAKAQFETFGAPSGDFKIYLPTEIIPFLIGNGLGQFTPIRNDRDVNSWQLGNFQGVDFYSSNLIKQHIAGIAGIDQDLLVFNSIDGTGTQVTFDFTKGDTVGYFKAGDIIEFERTVNAGVSLNAVTFTEYEDTTLPVQVRVVADADLTTNQVTVTVEPALIATSPSQDQSINRALVGAVDKAKAKDSHVAALLVSGNGFYVAFPKLPPLPPYPTVIVQDPDTAVALRMRYGAVDYAEPNVSSTIDLIYGKELIPEYAMRLIIPLSVLNAL